MSGWDTIYGRLAGGRIPVIVFASMLCVGLIGCAAPGEPSARHPTTPQAVTDLAARQQGDSVVLTFTLPRISTDQKALPGPPAVDIYRYTGQPVATPVVQPGAIRERKAPGRLVDTIPGDMVEHYEKNGRVEFPDPLDPSDLASQPGQQLVYAIRTRASRTRESEDSNSATVRVYPAPEPVADLHATVTEQAVVLMWTPSSRMTGGTPLASPPVYHVYRGEVESESAAAAVQDPSQAKLIVPLALLGEVSETMYRDANFEWGHTYFYTVRAATRFGSDLVESADPRPTVVTVKDVFPPAAPRGLEAVVIPATTEAPAYVELAWAISPESDLAGYVVYRSEQMDMLGTRMNNELLPAPTFRDISVRSGQRYFYRVAAVDRSGNESPASSVVVAGVPGP